MIDRIPSPPELALALGFASWRRLRGMRTIGEWKARVIVEDLLDVGDPRREKLFGADEFERLMWLARQIDLVLVAWPDVSP